MKRSCLLVCLAMIAALAPALARGQAIQSVTPMAAAPGKTTEVILRGTKLDEPLRVWTSLPAQVQVVAENVDKKDRTEVKLQVTVDAAVPPQIGGLFVATAAGVSDPIFFAIDDLPSVADNGKNRTLAEAQELPLLAAVDGQCDGTQADFYKVMLTAGQRLSVEVLASRMASDLDPILELLDANGKVLQSADDDLSLGSEGRLSFTSPATGAYVISIRDVRYRGGANFRYRLRVGDFPLVSTAFPLAAIAGPSANVEATGPAVEGVAPLAIAPATATSGRQAIGFKLPGGLSSAMTTMLASTHAQGIEAEPNDTPETATKITLPCGINGRFATDKDRDQFTFDAKANETYLFRPFTRSLGSPCYVQLAIFKPDGSLLQEAPVSESDEQPLAVTFPADGAYRLVVEELLRRSGPQFTWHVEATPFGGFGLQLKPDKATPTKLAVPKNGAISLEVQAVRLGYDGPITLSVEPADRGFVLLNNVIGEKQPATRLIIIAPPGLNAGDALALRFVGTGERNGQKFSMPVSTAAVVRLKAPQLSYPPAWLDGLIPVAIVNEAPELFTITPSVPQPLYPRTAAQMGFTLVMDRKHGEFKDPLTVLAQNLPAGVTAAVAREGNGPQEKYNVVLKAPKEIAEAKQDITFQCYGEMKGQGRLLTVTLPLAIVTPITTTLTPEGPIAPGQKQKVKVSVVRFNPGSGEDKQPITIKWKKLPPGVTAPGDATIAADQTETVVELSAAADAAVGPFDGLTVEAVTKFQGADVALESAPAKWEVKP